jgi:hypothetical protein
VSVAGLQQQIKSLFILVFKAAFSSLFDWGDLHARAHTLARVRRGRMDLSDRWDNSGRTARDNYLTCYPAAAALLILCQFRFNAPPAATLPTRRR